MVTDLLRFEYINRLPQPFIANLYGDVRWPVESIDVETGLIRIDVCGLLQVIGIGDVRSFEDAAGNVHDPETFYEKEREGVQ